MKHIFFFSLLLWVFQLEAQAPQEFKYQAVVRDGGGQLVSNQLISLRLTLLKESSIGAEVYSETQSLATNGYGVVSISVGSGSVVSGSFTGIDWGADDHFIKTELDLSGGSNFEFMGTSQIISVPYALHSETAATSLDDSDRDPINEIQQLTIVSDSIVLSSGGSVYIGNYLDNTDSQTLTLDGNSLSISNGNSVVLSGTIDLDADPENELQVLTLSNDTLYLSDGNFVVIPEDNDADPANEIQSLSHDNGTISISGGNSVTVPDVSPSNEIQDLSISANTLSISQSNSVSLPLDGDGDSNNEVQSLSLNGSDLTISQGNTVTLPPDGDSDDTNELQTLSYDNNTLTISDGNSVSLGSPNFDIQYPDGLSGFTPITVEVGWDQSSNQPEGYSPPMGKNLYIQKMSGGSSYGYDYNLRINDSPIWKGESPGMGNNNTPNLFMHNPIILSSNDIIYSNWAVSSGSIYDLPYRLYGFLVDASIEPVTISFTFATSVSDPLNEYVVPAGKNLVILNYCCASYIYVNGVLFSNGWYNTKVGTTNGSEINYNYPAQSDVITLPIILSSGDTISGGGGTSLGQTINGYLIDN
ncbi:hypothetical protein N8927_03845 [Crocinitomicaceae bacterium]|nr:hypothetical protein [Crocinitomicaceae bacterium]